MENIFQNLFFLKKKNKVKLLNTISFFFTIIYFI